MSGPAETLRANREKVFLAVYLLGIVLFASLLSPMLGQAWERSGLVRTLFDLRHVIGLSLEAIAAFALGLFFGLLVLMAYDPKKRLQGVLLIGGTAIGLAILARMDLLLVNIDFGENLLWLFSGFAVGLLYGGGQKLLELNNSQALEFRRASRGVYAILTAIMVLGFIEYHLVYPVPFDVRGGEVQFIQSISQPIDLASGFEETSFNAILSAGFVVTTKRFVEYDADQDFLVLGPKGSGKSLLLVGAYLEALEQYTNDQSDTPLNPSQDLMSLVGELDRDERGWFVDATRTQELDELRFRYVHGSVFPKNVTLSGIDYAGEWLEDIPDALMGTTEDEELPPTLKRVSESVEAADTLVLLIDCERYMNEERLDIEAYFDILQATDKNVVLVATKADLLAEEFRQERGLEAHQFYDEFKQYVHDQLSVNQSIQALIAQTSGADIHPVYYQTRVNEEGERVPMRNSGSVTTVGFDELLNRLGEK